MCFAAQVWSYQFDGHDSVDQNVACAIDNTHAAFANARFQSIPTSDDFA
jgi:hypothetical protein